MAGGRACRDNSMAPALHTFEAGVSVGLIGSIGVGCRVNIIHANANTPEQATLETPRTLWSCKGRSAGDSMVQLPGSARGIRKPL